ncbi:hypothetical protein JCM5353_002977 [Sporobolomyces roseus]
MSSSRAPSRQNPNPAPPESSSDDESLIEQTPPSAKGSDLRDPLWGLRRVNTLVGLLGAGALSIGSCLVIALYVIGPPRLNDLATSVTAISFLTLVGGCIATIPSWIGAAIVLFGAKPRPDSPPPHAKLLRMLCLIATLLATVYAILGLVIYVLLQEQESFVDFCLQNLPDSTKEECTSRWNRNWMIILAVAIVLLYHIAFGFPLYRYTRGPQGGAQLKDGYLLELAHRGNEEERRGSWSSDSESEGEVDSKRRSARSRRQGSQRSSRMSERHRLKEEW